MPDEVHHSDPVVHDLAEESAFEDTERRVEEGTALCLSGGGYRAMLFHVGSLWRLNDAAMLEKVARVSSVSGGSITAGVLGMNWSRLGFSGDGVAAAFETALVEPVRAMASTTIDRGAVLGGIFLPGPVSSRVAKSYRDVLFGDRTLQDLPDDDEGPRFVINATNLQSGVLWRFSKPYMADYKVGRVDEPKVPLATAVAASSAFPPVLSPVDLGIDPSDFTEGSKSWVLADLQHAGRVTLSDGGVYDNLGLEAAYKRYDTLLVSNGGGLLTAERRVPRDWARHSVRVTLVIDSQVRKLRRRQLVGSFVDGRKKGTYWAVSSDIDDYGLADALPVDDALVEKLASTPTRLKALESRTQKLLINWGFVMCDTALRRWVRPDLPRPSALPYDDAPLAR